MKINKNINKLTANSIYYFKIDNLVECEKVLKELIKIDSNNIHANMLLGIIYNKKE